MTDWPKVSTNVLRMCKQTSPTFWSKDRMEGLVKPWAFVFEKSGLTAQDIYRGVTEFYAKDTTGDRPSPGQIIGAARQAKTRAMNTPEGRRQAEAERRRREEEREQALMNGSWRPYSGA